MYEDKHKNQAVLLRLHFVSDRESVSGALESAMMALTSMNLSAEEIGECEILLAEVINNIVEHAYSGCADGPVEMVLHKGSSSVHFSFLDKGLPMPEGQVPFPRKHNLDCVPNDLPEGGFGWNIIRSLGHEISYLRLGDENHLSFSVSVGDSA